MKFRRNYGENYIESEIEFIEKSVKELKPIEWIAEALEREPSSLRLAILRNCGNIGQILNRVTTDQLADMCNVDRTTVSNSWIKVRGLPAIRYSLSEGRRGQYYISVKQFWKWAKGKRGLRFDKFDIAQFKINGSLPIWFKDMRGI